MNENKEIIRKYSEIERALGIDPYVIYEAMKQGVCIKTPYDKMDYIVPKDFVVEFEEKRIAVYKYVNYVLLYPFSEYQDTWSLMKMEKGE